MVELVAKDSFLVTQWRLLLVYNLYRFCCILFFTCFVAFSNLKSQLLFSLLLIYSFLGCVFLYLWYKKWPDINRQALLSGSVDIIFMVILFGFITDMRSAFVVLLNVNVAALSIIVPGRLAIFFAAITSCMLLGASSLEYMYLDTHPEAFYFSGIQGASIFATALAVWFLANRLRMSEQLAYNRGTELQGMQRINDYIVQRLQSGVIYVDSNRHIKFMNALAKTYFNWNKPFLHNLHQLSSDLDSQCQQFIDKKIKTAQTILKEDYLRVYFFLIPVEDITDILIFLEDMTSIAQQAQQLKLASLGRFSASIAHELRNPLGAIAHAIQLMGETDVLNSEDARLKEMIMNNCARMNAVIKNILQLSRQEKPQPATIDFEHFLESFRSNFCMQHACKMTINYLANNKPFLFDKSQLEQILVILCDNALLHSGKSVGDLHIIIELRQANRITEISITDNGKGIDEASRYDIFEPFFTTIHSGLGMGLFIAKELCEINQAKLALSATEEGACFLITVNQTSEMLYG